MKTFVVGVGITPFTRMKTTVNTDQEYPELVRKATMNALDDCQLDFSQVQVAVAGYCYGDPTAGQRGVYQVGLTGIPILNVNNNCSTGSSAIFLARQMILAGKECVLAVGFEQMTNSLSQVYHDQGWRAPTEKHWEQMYKWNGNHSVKVSKDKIHPKWNEFTDNVTKVFGYAAQEHMNRYGTTREQLAQVAYKNHRQGSSNINALNRKVYSVDKILKSPMLIPPLTILQTCSAACGAAAAILCSEEFVLKHNLQSKAVEIVAQSMVTDTPVSMNSGSFISLSGFDLAQMAAAHVYREANITAEDIDVFEVHDCFSINELLMYEALGLCQRGEGGKLIQTSSWIPNTNLCSLGNRWVVNPSGGLLSKGHPIGATGVTQCHELVHQLRGDAGETRQVPNARQALQHNFGMGSAAVVTLYRRDWNRSNL